MTFVTTWSDDRVEELKKLHAEGYSASQIAFMLGGATRNSVIGKASRLGLKQQPKKQSSVPRAPREPKRKMEHQPVFRFVAANGNSAAIRMLKSVQTEMPKLRCSEIPPRNLPLSELEENDCRYIPGNDYLYCARPKRPGSSYCWACHDIVWVKPVLPKPKAWVNAACAIQSS